MSNALYPRLWQKEAAEAVLKRLCAFPVPKGQAGLLSIPIGAGKTIVMAEVIRLLTEVRQPGWSVLVLTSTIVTAQQYAERFREALENVRPVHLIRTSRELAEKTNTTGTILVSTAQKLLDKGSQFPRRPAPPYSLADRLLVIVEEASQRYFGQTYSDMRSRFPNAAFLGFTCLPTSRQEDFFGPLLYEYSYAQAYRDGLFRPVRYQERLWRTDGPMIPRLSDPRFPLSLSVDSRVKALADWIADQEPTGRCALLLCENLSAVSQFYYCLLDRLGPRRLRVSAAKTLGKRSGEPPFPPEESRWNGAYFHGLILACTPPPASQALDVIYLDKTVGVFELARCLSLLSRKREGQSGGGLLVDFRGGWDRIAALLPEGFPLYKTPPPAHTSASALKSALAQALADRQYLRAELCLQQIKADLPEEGASLSDQLTFLFPPSMDLRQRERYWQRHRDTLAWQCGLWYLLSQDSDCAWEPPEEPEPAGTEEAETPEDTVLPLPPAGTPQERGARLELAAKVLIQNLFAQNGEYELESLRLQTAGTQFGFDLLLTYLDSAGVRVTCAVECKNYQSIIGTGEVTGKLSELQSLDREIEHWILISPNSKVNNQLLNMRKQWQERDQWYPILDIQFWTPDENVEELFRLFPELHAQFYQSPPGGLPGKSEAERAEILERWRRKLAPVPHLPPQWKAYLRDPDLLLTQIESDQRTKRDYRSLYLCHAPIRLLDEQEQPIGGFAEDYLLQWLERPGQPCALLLGDFGDGKSFFTYVLARKLAENFSRSPRAGWIPLRLSLRELGDRPMRPREFLNQRLQEFQSDVFAWNQVSREYRFLIMLDGLDEMSLGMHDGAVLDNLSKLEGLMEQFREHKLLVTSRKMAIYADKVRERILDALEQPEVLHLAPVAPGDRVAFLERLADTPERKNRLLKIRSTYDLLELAAKPLFLSMMRLQLDSDDIHAMDASGIYQDYAERVLTLKYNYQLSLPGDHTSRKTVRDRMLYLLEELALCLQQSGADSISLADFKARLETPDLAQQLWDSAAGEETAEDADNRLSNRSLLKYDCRKPENRTFCHRSMKEYFLAKAIVRRLWSEEDAGRLLLASCGFSHEVLRFAGQELRNLTGGRRRLAGQRLAAFAHESREKWDSPLREQLARLGTNSADLLHAGGFGLPGQDWSGLLLDHVFLSGADLSGKDFSHSSLRFAHLDNADLSRCDLRGCDFTGVQFEKSGHLVSFAADPREGALLACYRDGKLRRWRTADGQHQTMAQIAPVGAARLLLSPEGREGLALPERFLFFRRLAEEIHAEGYIALRPGLQVLDVLGNAALIQCGNELCLLDTAAACLLWRREFAGVLRACLMAERIVVFWTERTGVELTDLSGQSPRSGVLPQSEPVSALRALAHSGQAGSIAVGYANGELQLLHASLDPATAAWRLSFSARAPGHGERVLTTALDGGGKLYAGASSGAVTRYWANESRELEADRVYRLELKCAGARIEGVRPLKQYELLRSAIEGAP